MIDREVQSYRHKKTSAWKKSRAWQGFFMALRKSKLASKALKNGEWGYVANASGGFMGFWWNQDKNKSLLFEPYLQLEHSKLCFKIKVNDEIGNEAGASDQSKKENNKTRKERWGAWWVALQAVKHDFGIEISKGKRVAGLTMTVAYVEIGIIEELCDEDGIMDVDKIVAFLERAERLMNEAIKSLHDYGPSRYAN